MRVTNGEPSETPTGEHPTLRQGSDGDDGSQVSEGGHRDESASTEDHVPVDLVGDDRDV